jgi:hypothetical protein
MVLVLQKLTHAITAGSTRRKLDVAKDFLDALPEYNRDPKLHPQRYGQNNLKPGHRSDSIELARAHVVIVMGM